MRGGYTNSPLSPADANSTDVTGQGLNAGQTLDMGMGIDGQGLTNYGVSSVNVQQMADQAGGRRRHKMRGGYTPLAGHNSLSGGKRRQKGGIPPNWNPPPNYKARGGTTKPLAINGVSGAAGVFMPQGP
jgi:hypothetical protein